MTKLEDLLWTKEDTVEVKETKEIAVDTKLIMNTSCMVICCGGIWTPGGPSTK